MDQPSWLETRKPPGLWPHRKGAARGHHPRAGLDPVTPGFSTLLVNHAPPGGCQCAVEKRWPSVGKQPPTNCPGARIRHGRAGYGSSRRGPSKSHQGTRTEGGRAQASAPAGADGPGRRGSGRAGWGRGGVGGPERHWSGRAARACGPGCGGYVGGPAMLSGLECRPSIGGDPPGPAERIVGVSG